jgi:hypothetical protein
MQHSALAAMDRAEKQSFSALPNRPESGEVDLDGARKMLTVDSRLPSPGLEATHPVHETRASGGGATSFKMNATWSVKLPDGRVVRIEPDRLGKLSGLTLLFAARMLVVVYRTTIPPRHCIFL